VQPEKRDYIGQIHALVLYQLDFVRVDIEHEEPVSIHAIHPEMRGASRVRIDRVPVRALWRRSYRPVMDFDRLVVVRASYQLLVRRRESPHA